MKHALEIGRILILVGIIAFVALALEIALRTDKALKHFDQLIQDSDRTVVIAGAATTNIEKTLRAERAASDQQIAAATEVTNRLSQELIALNSLTESAQAMVDRTDDGLNGPRGTIAQANEFIYQLGPLAQSAKGDIDAAGPPLRNLTEATQSLATQAPPIMEKMNVSLGDFEGVAADARQGSDLALQREKELLKPETLTIRVLKGLWDATLGAAEMHAYVGVP